MVRVNAQFECDAISEDSGSFGCTITFLYLSLLWLFAPLHRPTQSFTQAGSNKVAPAPSLIHCPVAYLASLESIAVLSVSQSFGLNHYVCVSGCVGDAQYSCRAYCSSCSVCATLNYQCTLQPLYIFCQSWLATTVLSPWFFSQCVPM